MCLGRKNLNRYAIRAHLMSLVRDGVFVLPVQGDSGLDGPHGDPGPKGNLGRGVCDVMRLLEIESGCVCFSK